jgi:hypothetical protein
MQASLKQQQQDQMSKESRGPSGSNTDNSPLDKAPTILDKGKSIEMEEVITPGEPWECNESRHKVSHIRGGCRFRTIGI